MTSVLRCSDRRRASGSEPIVSTRTSPSTARTVALTISAPVLRLRCLAAARISDQTRRTAAASSEVGAAGGSIGGAGARSSAGTGAGSRGLPRRRRALGRLGDGSPRPAVTAAPFGASPTAARTGSGRSTGSAAARSARRSVCRLVGTRRSGRSTTSTPRGGSRPLRRRLAPGPSGAHERPPRRARLRRIRPRRRGRRTLPVRHRRGCDRRAALDPFEPLQQRGLPRRRRRQQHPCTQQFQQQPRRRRSAHLDQARVQDLAVARPVSPGPAGPPAPPCARPRPHRRRRGRAAPASGIAWTSVRSRSRWSRSAANRRGPARPRRAGRRSRTRLRGRRRPARPRRRRSARRP